MDPLNHCEEHDVYYHDSGSCYFCDNDKMKGKTMAHIYCHDCKLSVLKPCNDAAKAFECSNMSNKDVLPNYRISSFPMPYATHPKNHPMMTCEYCAQDVHVACTSETSEGCAIRRAACTPPTKSVQVDPWIFKDAFPKTTKEEQQSMEDTRVAFEKLIEEGRRKYPDLFISKELCKEAQEAVLDYEQTPSMAERIALVNKRNDYVSEYEPPVYVPEGFVEEDLSEEQEREAEFQVNKVPHHVHDDVAKQEHYETNAIQPIDYIIANGLGFCEGNVVKYVTRWHKKGGKKDLLKAIVYLNFLLNGGRG